MTFNIRSYIIFSFIIFIGLLGVQSCKEAPTAAFYYEPLFNPEVGDTIFFYNESENATEYEWYFGNGDSSNLESPYTFFEVPYEYKVLLNAINSAGNDTISVIIDVNYATVLGFFIYEPDSVTLISDCNVWVYSDSADYYSSADPQFSELTNEGGVAAFENLETISYYVSIFKETADGLYIREGLTQPLEQNAINLYAIVMEFIPSGTIESFMEEKGMNNDSGVIKSLKKLYEFPRVSSDLFPGK